MTRKQALAMRIEDSPLSTRARNTIMFELGRQATVADLIECTPYQLTRIPNFWLISLREVETWLAEHKLKLRDPKAATTDTASIGRIAK